MLERFSTALQQRITEMYLYLELLKLVKCIQVKTVLESLMSDKTTVL